jgi:hypothetical protein
MNRQQLIDSFSHIAPVKNVGQSYKRSDEPYIVLKAMSQSPDTRNSYGGYQNYNLLCYAPDTTTVILDNLVNAVKNRALELKEQGVEFTGELGEDFHDTDIKMYMRFVSIRVPRQIQM